MRIYLMLAVAFMSLVAHSNEVRQILIPSRASEFADLLSKTDVLFSDGNAAIVQVPDSKLELWSEFVHQHFGLCGGFVDVTAELQEGKDASKLLRQYSGIPALSPYSAPISVIYNDKVAALVAGTSSEFIASFLIQLTAFNDRSATTTNGTLAADFLADKATELGKKINGFQVRKVATRTYPNQPSVVATLLGSKPNLPAIVVGGHMDTLSNNKPGADDDGSGSAMVMEALRNVASSGARFERTIHFIWYAAEERGLVGSSNVVRDFKEKQTSVAAALQFDMTGWVNPSGLHEIYLTDDYTDAGLTQTLENIIKTYLPTVTIGHASCGYACSDHASWNAAQIPSVYPFESHHDDYNRRIHTSSDKMDYLSLEHMTKFARIGVAFLGQMAVLN